MSNKYAFIAGLCLLTSMVTAQNKDLDDRSGHLKLSLGVDYRITPIYANNPHDFGTTFTWIDKQNSGMALNLGLEYFITNNLSLGFKNSFRYGLVSANYSAISGLSGTQTYDHKLLMDFHLSGTYYFDFPKNGDLFLEAGISLLNRNSEVILKRTIENPVGDPITFFSTHDYSFWSNKVAIGYRLGRNKFSVGAFLTQNSDYFKTTTFFAIPFVNYSYDLADLIK